MTAARVAVTAATAGRFPGVPAALVDLGVTRPGDVELLVVTGEEAAAHAAALKRWRGSGARVVQLDAAPTGRGGRLLGRAGRDDLHRSTDVRVAADEVLLPAVDPAVTNPVGWRRTSSVPVAVALHAPTAAAGAALDADRGNGEVLVLVPPTTSGAARRAAIGDRPAKRWDDDEGRRDRLRRCGVLVSDPAWDDDAEATVGTVLTAVALGIPVVTTPDAPVVAAGVRVVTAEPAQLFAVARDLVADDVRREQASVVGRRDVLSHHTGRARLRRLAAEVGLDDPSPDPRVAVLLATNRASFVAPRGPLDRSGRPTPPASSCCCSTATCRCPPRSRPPTSRSRCSGSAPTGSSVRC